jgi:DNA-binding MarR family transcriptional regulator
MDGMGWVEPLGFAERIALASEVDGRLDIAEDAARAAERHEASFDTERLAERMKWGRTQRPIPLIADLTAKQASILGNLLEADCTATGLSLRALSTDLARSAWGIGVKDWTHGGLATTLQRLERRGLVRREEQQRVKLRDPRWLWFLTPAGDDAMDVYLDALEDWELSTSP